MSAGATKKLAVKVIRRLRSSGHEALLAGGCVRDMLMGKRPADYDVATSATPQEVKRLFGHVLMVGAKFGVAMVMEHRRRVEVATFRSDVSYSDGRRPDGVRFTSAREDALRRDFTINGMFYDPLSQEVVDYVGGQKDLAAGVVRAIGRAEQRFGEDYLRMLRAARFAARLGFRIAPATAAAIRRHAGEIVHISGERVREEMEKMLGHPSAALAVRTMRDLGLLEPVLPELFAEERRLIEAIRRLEAVARRGDARLAMAALLCGLPRPEIRAIVRRWGGSNCLRESLTWLSEHLQDWKTLPGASLAELKRTLAHPRFGHLEALSREEERATTGGTAGWRAVRRRASRIHPRDVAPPPLLSGEDVKQFGLPQGPGVGRVLRRVYEAQLNEQLRTRSEAIRYARQILGIAREGKRGN